MNVLFGLISKQCQFINCDGYARPYRSGGLLTRFDLLGITVVPLLALGWLLYDECC